MRHTTSSTPWRWVERARRRAGGWLVRGGLGGLSRVSRLHPRSRPSRHGVEVIRDVAYDPDGDRAHLLDVYRPIRRDGPLPALLYVHGGGFRILSKDTHWMMGLAFAKRGYVVFNINYRLAPRHPFPAAVDDVCRACTWVLDHAHEFGGDRERLVWAGESAGANLVMALTVSACYRRPEPWARVVFEADPRPRAVLPACGILEVSNHSRFARAGGVSMFVRDRIDEIARGYLPEVIPHTERGLADPLTVIESVERPERPLPPICAIVGTSDPLVDDTRRLKVAVDRLGGDCEAHLYEGGFHAFHALGRTTLARRAWRDQFGFLARVLDNGAVSSPRS